VRCSHFLLFSGFCFPSPFFLFLGNNDRALCISRCKRNRTHHFVLAHTWSSQGSAAMRASNMLSVASRVLCFLFFIDCGLHNSSNSQCFIRSADASCPSIGWNAFCVSPAKCQGYSAHHAGSNIITLSKLFFPPLFFRDQKISDNDSRDLQTTKL